MECFFCLKYAGGNGLASSSSLGRELNQFDLNNRLSNFVCRQHTVTWDRVYSDNQFPGGHADMAIFRGRCCNLCGFNRVVLGPLKDDAVCVDSTESSSDSESSCEVRQVAQSSLDLINKKSKPMIGQSSARSCVLSGGGARLLL